MKLKPGTSAAPTTNPIVRALPMIYLVTVLVFLGETAIRALLGTPDFLAAFGHGVLAGLVVIGIDAIRSCLPRS